MNKDGNMEKVSNIKHIEHRNIKQWVIISLNKHDKWKQVILHSLIYIQVYACTLILDEAVLSG